MCVVCVRARIINPPKHQPTKQKGRGEREDQRAYLSTLFVVPTDVAEDFYSAWTKYADKVDEEKENDIYTLKKASCCCLFCFVCVCVCV